MTLKFNLIPNITEIEELIRESNGNIFLQLADEYVDLKETSMKLDELFEKYSKDKKQFIFHVFDNKDYFQLVNYMIGTTYTE